MKPIVEKMKNFVFPSVATYYPEPLVAERGQGKYVYDDTGRQYLDFFAGIVTVGLGHCHPDVTEKVCEQVRTLQHTSTLYVLKPLVELAEKLASITPGRLQKCYFVNSGTEAVETAVLVSTIYTGKDEVIALRHGYSGRSLLAMSLTGHAPWRQGRSWATNVRLAHSPYCYRCAFGRIYPDCDLECAKDIEELIRTSTSGQIAAFVAEPVAGVGGLITPPPEYFKVAVEIIKRYGGIFIADEVQCGFGRTGKMFAIEHYGVEPDMMTFAKALGNGVPIGAVIALPEIADAWKGPTISTFGGNPVSMTAGLATLATMEKLDIVKNSETVGAYLRQALLNLKDKYKCIGEVRGLGLMLGMEMVGENKAPAMNTAVKFLERTRDLGLLVGRGGLYGNVVRVTPPLIITKSDVDEAVRMMDEALSGIS